MTLRIPPVVDVEHAENEDGPRTSPAEMKMVLVRSSFLCVLLLFLSSVPWGGSRPVSSPMRVVVVAAALVDGSGGGM